MKKLYNLFFIITLIFTLSYLTGCSNKSEIEIIEKNIKGE